MSGYMRIDWGRKLPGCVSYAVLAVIGSNLAWADHLEVFNTPAYFNPLIVEDLESTPLGSLPTGWVFSGFGSAQTVDLDNHTPGGSRSVRLTADGYYSALLTIQMLDTTTTGCAVAIRSPQGQGTLTTRYFAIVNDVPNTLIHQNTIDLSTGVDTVSYPGSPDQEFTFNASDLENWRVDDLDTIPCDNAGQPAVECWHGGSGTSWCHCIAPNGCPVGPLQFLIEVELTAEGQESLTVFIDDVHLYDETIICGLTGGQVPTVSEWGLIVMTLLSLTAGTIVFARRRRPAVA